MNRSRYTLTNDYSEVRRLIERRLEDSAAPLVWDRGRVDSLVDALYAVEELDQLDSVGYGLVAGFFFAVGMEPSDVWEFTADLFDNDFGV